MSWSSCSALCGVNPFFNDAETSTLTGKQLHVRVKQSKRNKQELLCVRPQYVVTLTNSVVPY